MEQERVCPVCKSKLIYRGQSSINRSVQLWQCSGMCYPKTFHLQADGTQVPMPPFPGRKAR